VKPGPGTAVPDVYRRFMLMDVLGLKAAEIDEMMKRDFIEYMHALDYATTMCVLRVPPHDDKNKNTSAITFSENADADVIKPGDLECSIVPSHRKEP
jgi:hypothetical protein